MSSQPARPATPLAILRGREPKGRFRDLDRRTKRFILGSLVTMLAVAIVFTYLLPLFYMAATALKSEDQLANGSILPMSPRTVTVDGEEYEIFDVPIEGEVRQLALVRPGRTESTFVDPSAVDDLAEGGEVTEIVWRGNWRTLSQAMSFDPQFGNFADARNKIDFYRMLRNTAWIAGVGMAGTVISSTFVAYGLSRFRIRWKGVILGSLLATIILPRFVTLVPTYILYNKLGWIGTFLPLTVPHFFANAYNVFLMRQFFLTIPRDLDEAAAIDGAGPLRILFTVILPQAKGAVLAVALFHFFFAWNDFLEPLIFLQGKQDKLPISVGLYQFLNIYDTNIPMVQAGAIMAMAVPIVVFLLLQRVFLRGIDLSGSIK
jgi:multiple sugar transport system permease protein